MLATYILVTEKTNQIKIVNFGPKGTTVSTGFNIQQNGQSAIWIQASNIKTPYVSVIWNNTALTSTFHEKNNIVTALVPNELLQSKGKIEIYIIDQENKIKSNKAIFEIK